MVLGRYLGSGYREPQGRCRGHQSRYAEATSCTRGHAGVGSVSWGGWPLGLEVLSGAEGRVGIRLDPSIWSPQSGLG